MSRSKNASARFLALGPPSDRKAFTITIRAFALAGKLGDRLTLIGYGHHRRRLEKWATALGIDQIVTFAEPDHRHVPDCGTYDAAILLSQRGERHVGILLDGLAKGLRVISMSQDASIIELLRDRPLGAAIVAGNVLAVSSAMLTV